MRLSADGGAPLRIGHRGAPALAPENTLAGFAAALEHGFDLVELDVVGRRGTLAVAHSVREWTPANPTLDEALAFFAHEAPQDVGLVADLKTPGVEAGVLSALRRHRLLERTLVASVHPASLRALRSLEPGLATARTYPRDRLGVGEARAAGPVLHQGVVTARALLPYRIASLLRRARADVAMIHHLFVTPALVARCRALGAPVYAWTVEDEAALARVRAAGVDGIVANDPGILAD